MVNTDGSHLDVGGVTFPPICKCNKPRLLCILNYLKQASYRLLLLANMAELWENRVLDIRFTLFYVAKKAF